MYRYISMLVSILSNTSSYQVRDGIMLHRNFANNTESNIPNIQGTRTPARLRHRARREARGRRRGSGKSSFRDRHRVIGRRDTSGDRGRHRDLTTPLLPVNARKTGRETVGTRARARSRYRGGVARYDRMPHAGIYSVGGDGVKRYVTPTVSDRVGIAAGCK